MSLGDSPTLSRSRYRAEAFGLRIGCEWPLPGASLTPDSAQVPEFDVQIREAEPTKPLWEAPGELLHCGRLPDDTEWFSVWRGAHGYQFRVRGYGRHLIALDGQTIRSEPRSTTAPRRNRFVMSHGLPTASLLQGYDVLHASAIARNGNVAAFTGASGLGKTTLAAQLVLTGAQLVSDDVLVLESSSGGLTAHPGLPFMAMREEDAAKVSSQPGRLGPPGQVTDKVHFEPVAARSPLPLRVLFHLETGPELAIVAVRDGDAMRALSLAYLPFLMSPQRLAHHLEVAHILTEHVAQFRLICPRSGVTAELLTAVDAYLDAHGL